MYGLFHNARYIEHKLSTMLKRRNWRDATVYGTSKTIPGQSLVPAELLKRHLAGTLPDIDLSQRYEYHYDENGNQIGEPFPIEMHELHKLALRVRREQEANTNREREVKIKKYRDSLIQQYKEEQLKLGPPKTDAPAS